MKEEKEIINYKEIINKIKPELDKVIAFLEKELAKLKGGRASPSLVEDVICDCFGQKFPLKQLAAISVPEPRQILIQPWDKSYIEGIVKALEKTGVGANPVVDKDIVRINLPPLTEDYRKNLLKILGEKKEEARKGETREDDKYRAKDEIQELVDQYNEKIEAIGERKEKEILD